jgi:hypothetical protein
MSNISWNHFLKQLGSLRWPYFVILRIFQFIDWMDFFFINPFCTIYVRNLTNACKLWFAVLRLLSFLWLWVFCDNRFPQIYVYLSLKTNVTIRMHSSQKSLKIHDHSWSVISVSILWYYSKCPWSDRKESLSGRKVSVCSAPHLTSTLSSFSLLDWSQTAGPSPQHPRW